MKSKVLGAGKHLELRRRGRWEYVERPNASGAVAIVGFVIVGFGAVIGARLFRKRRG